MRPARHPGDDHDDIPRSIAWIRMDTADMDEARFLADRRVIQLVERNPQIIAEASRRLPESLKAAHPGISWPQVAAIGNVLRHEYHRVSAVELWRLIRSNLDKLDAAILKMRATS